MGIAREIRVNIRKQEGGNAGARVSERRFVVLQQKMHSESSNNSGVPEAFMSSSVHKIAQNLATKLLDNILCRNVGEFPSSSEPWLRGS